MADPTAITAPAGVTTAPAAPAEVNGALEGHKPYVPDEAHVKEFTWQAVVTGTCLGLIFSAVTDAAVIFTGCWSTAAASSARHAVILVQARSVLPGA